MYVPDLIGHWPLDETSGTTANDYSGSGYNGTFAGSPAPSWATKGGLRCADFTGGNRINLPSAPTSVIEGGPGTLTAWVYADSFPNALNCVFGLRSDTGYFTRFDLFVKSNGKLMVNCSTSGAPNDGYDGTGTYTLSTGQWYFLAFNAGGAAGINGYVNGLLDKNVAKYGVLFDVAPAVEPAIGAHFTVYATSYFDGGIRDVRLYHRQLSANTIYAIYRGQAATFLNADF